jgi:hypothetical protein
MGDPKGAATSDRITLRGSYDLAIYYGPASVPFLAALVLGLDFTRLTWLIWLELLPRGFLLSLEILADKDFEHRSVPYRVTILLVVLAACLGAMAFFAMFFPLMRKAFETLFLGLTDGEAGPAFTAFYEEIGGLPVLACVAIAAVARAFRAYRIDVRQDPELAHIRHDTKERRTRRMFAFFALMLWIVAWDYPAMLAPIAPRFFGALATAIYCFLPLVALGAEDIKRRLEPFFKPA